MSLLRGFWGFVYEFIVGDDPILAGAAVLALGVTAALAASGVEAWWVAPAVVLVGLGISVLRESYPDPDESDGPGPSVG